MKKILTLLVLVSSLTLFHASAQTLDFDYLAPHPRILLSKGDVTNMRSLASESQNAKIVNDRVIALAEEFVNAEELKYELQGKSLQHIANQALRRIFYLSYAHAMTEDMRYVAAAERDMLSLSYFDDWNPSHYTETSQIMMALSIGYDWLYRRLSVHSRSIIGTAIYEKGLLPSQQVDFSLLSSTQNQICNAGLIYGALATMERSPELCKEIITKAIDSNKSAQKIYEPEGGYPQGYDAWSHNTGFEVMLVAALQSALGSDAGIAKQQCFMDSAHFVNYLVAPSDMIYNYGDCDSAQAYCSVAKYWFARESNDHSIVAIDEKFVSEKRFREESLLPLYMIFSSSMDLSKIQMPTQKYWHNSGQTPLYIYRSGWEPGSTYFAIKGGQAATEGGHMDAGSFIYELDGVRWAIELGQDDYVKAKQMGINTEDMSQQSSRWSLFRASDKAHNTITINNQPHAVNGKADIVSHHDTSREKGAEVDMTAVLSPQVRSAVRSAKLDKKDNLTITDQITNGSQPATIEWRMATTAHAEIVSPQVIMLSQDGKTLYLRLKTRSNSVAKVWRDTELKSYEKSIEGVNYVGFTINLKSGEQSTIEVQFSPTKTNVISRIKQSILKK